MISSLKKVLVTSGATLALLLGISLVPALSANAQVEDVCRGAGAAGVENCEQPEENVLEDLVTVILTVLSWVIGVVSVIMIIIGGFRYIISSGDSSQVQSAKNTILYAIVGLVIVLFAQLIIRFVISSVGEATQ